MSEVTRYIAMVNGVKKVLAKISLGFIFTTEILYSNSDGSFCNIEMC